MKKVIKLYLYILPIYSLIGIILSIFRTVYQDSYVTLILLVGLIMDMIVVIVGKQYLINKTMTFIFFLLMISCFVGLTNSHELSRRYITDFMLPFLFFSKIYIFKVFWRNADFKVFLKYYSKMAFWGSLILLPITYAIFNSGGVNRLAIFPPLELPFAAYMQSGGIYFAVVLLMILLYGKRAQLISVVATFVLFIFIFKKRNFIKYLFILIIGGGIMTFVFSNYGDNLAVKRLTSTYERFNNASDSRDAIDDIGGSRTVEVNSIMKEMNTVNDFVFGKGLAFTYSFQFNQNHKINSNAHFTPITLWSKYGSIFTVFFYVYIVSKLFKNKKRFFKKEYLTAIGVCLIVLIESFFSYALFVTPIFPVAFGYILDCQKK